MNSWQLTTANTIIFVLRGEYMIYVTSPTLLGLISQDLKNLNPQRVYFYGSMLLTKAYIYNVYWMKNSMTVRIAVGNAIPEQANVTQGEGTINGSLNTDDQEDALSSSCGTSPTLGSGSRNIATIPDSESISESITVLFADSDKDVEDQKISVDLLVKHYSTLLATVGGNRTDCPLCSDTLSPSQ